MLAPNQSYTHPDGRTLVITTGMDKAQAIGDIFFGTVQFGPMSAGMTVTEAGLTEAGFVLDEVQPAPESILPLEPTLSPPLIVEPEAEVDAEPV